MHEFCPLCSKNGFKIKVKAYQINKEDAVFMCSTEKCTWPAGYQEAVFIKRPIGKDWSKTWDEEAKKHFRSEHDPFHDLLAYTPPQTPGTEALCKDIVSGVTSTSVTVPDKVINPFSACFDDNVYMQQDFSTFLSKDSSLDGNNSSINNVNNRSSKPKLVFSESVNYKLEKLPSKGYVFIKNNEKNNKLCKNNAQLRDVKINTKANASTSVVNNSALIQNDNVSNNNLFAKLKMKNLTKVGGFRRLSKKSNRGIPYQKFDFNELLKAKSTNKKECENNANKVNEIVEEPKICIEIKKECEIEIKNEEIAWSLERNGCDNLLNPRDTNVGKACVNNVNKVSMVIEKPKSYIEIKDECKTEIRNEEMAWSLERNGCDDLLNPRGTNVINESNNVELVNYDQTNVVNSISDSDFNLDLILGLTDSSKDSGVGQEMLENGDLDDLLAEFSNNLTNTTPKSEVDNLDEYQWINSFFRSSVI